MKRRDLILELVAAGCRLKRHGGRHDLYANPRSGRIAPVPRHNGISDTLAAVIRKRLGL